MARKKHTAEEIVTTLRQVEVLTAQGKPVSEAIRTIGMTEVKLRDELLNGEIFYTLNEARIVFETWRRHYNTLRPHSSLGYQPPAPETTEWPGSPASSSGARPSNPHVVPNAPVN